MSTRNLKSLFKPGSLALIGASERPQSVGAVVMENLLKGGFRGPIMPVNPNYQAINGVIAYKDIASLPITPEMAVVALPAPAVPDVIRQLAERGTRAAIVLSAGMTHQKDASGKTLQDQMLEIAAAYEFRILGPNCLGLMVPGIGLNAGFAHTDALPGNIAFVSQSGAMCTAVLDWAKARKIGFSHFISLGDAGELDFGDVLDYLGSDPDTRAILLYIESIRQRRNFMSAARAAARNKPVLAIKSGRFSESAAAAASHTGALAGADDVYTAALKRAGVLRVYDFEELFAAVETLAHYRPLKGEGLAIVTNGGGIGVIAVDNLIEDGGTLAQLSDETIAELSKVLPATWSHANPVDIIGDAPGSRYVDAMQVLMRAPEVNSILCMHAPTAISSATEVAEKIIGLKNENKSLALSTCWVGEHAVAPARAMFQEAGIPTFDTPNKAVRAFVHLVEYRRAQEMLLETPASLPAEFTANTKSAKQIIDGVLAEGRDILSEPEAKAVFAAYGIPVVQTHIAKSPAEAKSLTKKMGTSVALKILSNDITHKSDVGGVVLNLKTPEEAELAAERMLERVSETYPDADIIGFTVQEMARRPGAYELIIGVTTDPIFGPVILFGQGGTAVEVVKDRAMGLPPLNMSLAQRMIAQTRIYNLLIGYRDKPPVKMEDINLCLVQVSQMVADIPEILELDINPLFADEKGVIAVDARIKVGKASSKGADRLAIRPYPKELEETVTVGPSNRQVLLRPVRPEDEPQHGEFVRKLSPEDIRFRFFGLVGELPHSELARLTQIDYAREMAFIATAPNASGDPETLGVVRTYTDPDNDKAEFSIVVRSDLKGAGLGRMLLEKMIRYCRERGTSKMVGQVMRENTAMLTFAENHGFQRVGDYEDGVIEIELTLN